MPPPPAITRLQTLTRDNSIILHGFCRGAAPQWGPLRDICLSGPEGTFAETTDLDLADKLVEAYARLFNRYEISYSLPTGVEPDKITAASSKGVITITIPKTPQAQPKKIAVKTQE